MLVVSTNTMGSRVLLIDTTIVIDINIVINTTTVLDSSIVIDTLVQSHIPTQLWLIHIYILIVDIHETRLLIPISVCLNHFHLKMYYFKVF